ncbi:helix-turn-helix domain-containing protein [Flammeovirga kamogawensis]|uniref:Helix-turn-helix domain-containing protein n=1 Tax=Flammeovirga kamogawensis TaxID=373891 RepID=A0ABX8H400_9BACT|nr:IS30 family transposase [Flammeovirga kamogawensis]QWG10428.1 helix-turn-helix domain-containing protein [Flammeovirga kamogawensis]TRX63938.1 helix-turn-helix domain-containing protein [Flammeovirga kamogawensis]
MKNLQLNDRKIIQKLIEEKTFTVPQIAEALDLSPSTIYRELKRNSHPVTNKYDAEYAHQLFLARKKIAGGSKRRRVTPYQSQRKNPYKLYMERRLLLWRSDIYSKIKFKPKKRVKYLVRNMYAKRLGIKEVTYHEDWKLFEQLVNHLALLQKINSQHHIKLDFKSRNTKKKTNFTLWKNPFLLIEKRKCV